MSNTAKILLVDDYPDNLVALHALLRNEDLELIDANSGPQALEALLAHEVALALIDVQMPDMDGFELAQMMRGAERTRQIPIVFLTAASRDQERIFEGYSIGAVDFLFKPIEPRILRSKVDVFVQLYRQKQQLAGQIAAQKEMLRVNELLSAAISHDLRNPLNAIVGAAEIIRRKAADDQVVWAAERVRSGGVRMGRLIEELLDFSTARLTGKLSLNPTFFDLGETMRRVVTEHELADPSISTVIENSGNLRVFWDEERIVRLLSNLIGNALTHGDRSEPVRVRMDGTTETEVVFSVHNKGYVSAAVLPSIFSPFKTSTERSAGASGLGLGLYIVDQIVKMHSGTIQVESTEATGTRFTLRLPRVPEAVRSQAPRSNVRNVTC